MTTNVRFPQGPIADASGYVSLEWVQWFQNPQFVTLDLGTTLAVTSGGTGLTGGTSGGVLAFTASDTIASSGELQANRLVLGGGAGVAPSTPVTLGTTTTVLHGNAAGAPTWAAISLTADVSGQLPLANGGTNANLTASNGGVIYSTASAFAINTPGSSGNWLKSAGAAAPVWTAPAALTKTDDTNVTLTLGGSATTALLNAASLTLGWTGTLGLARGGTNANLSATGGASQVLKQTSAGGAVTVGQLAASDLSNGTSGSGAVLLVASPTTTGTFTADAISASGNISTPGTIGAALSGANSGAFNVGRRDTGNSAYLIYSAAGSLQFYDGTSDRMVLTNGGAISWPSLGTTASAANAFLDSGASNNLLRSTSARRYKKDIKRVTAGELRTLDKLRPITYRSRCKADDQRRRHYGFIAEEVAKEDRKLAHFKKGKPDGVQYERVVVLLVAEVQRLKKEMRELRRKSP